MPNYLLIEQQDALEIFCQQCLNQAAIAIDTEFIRVSTFFAKPGLIQIKQSDVIGLIDPLVIQDWHCLAQVLESPDVCKVLHACDEDIELFYHFLSVKPQNVFDTQFAEGLLGEANAPSYQSLIESYLGINIEKDQRRSDWLKRPLASYQLAYAAADVQHLLTVYQRQYQRLEEQNKLGLMDLYYQEVLDIVSDEHFDKAVWRINDAWRLNALQFARLKHLAAWREAMMRKYDWPRKKVANNQALLAIAKQLQWNKYQLFEVDDMSQQLVRKEADVLLNTLARINEQDDHSEIMYRPIKDKWQRRLKMALYTIADKASIHPQLLIKKSQLKLLCGHVRQGHRLVPAGISPWRKEYYQQAIELLLNSEESNS